MNFQFPTPQNPSKFPVSSAPPKQGQEEMGVSLCHTVIYEPTENLRLEGKAAAVALGHEVEAFAAETDLLEWFDAAGGSDRLDVLVLRLNHDTALRSLKILQQMQQVSRKNGQAGTAPSYFVLAVVEELEEPSREQAWRHCGVDDFCVWRGPDDLANFVSRLASVEHFLSRSLPSPQTAPMRPPEPSLPYQDVFEHGPMAQLLLTAEAGQILGASLAALRLLGRQKADLLGKHLSLALPSIFDHPDFAWERLRQGEPLLISRLDYISHPGAVALPLRLEASVAAGEGPHHVLLTLHGLAAELDLRTEQNALARQDASMVTLRGLAREISDSLTSVLGNLELLARHPFPRQESRDCVEAAQTALRSIEGFSRKAAGLARLREPMASSSHSAQAVGLKPLLERAVVFALVDGHATPVVHVPENIWPVKGDVALLTDAVLQVARNAARAMPPGGHLFVTARNSMADARLGRDAAVELELRDEGPGIPPQDLDRVFDPFFSTWGREGLGLTKAAAILRSHGGSLRVNSNPGQGTTVTLRLPPHVGAMLDPIGPGAAFGAPATTSRGPETAVRILVMDDDPQIRSLVSKILVGQGYAVYATEDGEKAVQAYVKALKLGTPFDLAILDLDVRGGMGGVEAAALMKREHPQLKAVLATGYVDDALLAAHADHGFTGILLKPFEVERLLGLVTRLTEPVRSPSQNS